MNEIRILGFEMNSDQYEGQIATINLKGLMPIDHAAPFLHYLNTPSTPGAVFKIKCYLEMV